MYNTVIIGSGCAGAVMARLLAEKKEKVLVIEQRDHIGGNCYDRVDENGILIHQYGPHIFHTNNQRVYEFLSRFTKWYEYDHQVVGNVYGNLLPIPFNLNTLKIVYGEEKGSRLEKKLIEQYGQGSRVPILELKKNEDREIKEIAEFVYENIFLKYTMKQWGQKPEDVDVSVTARVPVVLSYDNRYFQDIYQGMPLEGYTKLFENMLAHENITVRLNTKAQDVLKIEQKGILKIDGQVFGGKVIYTGAIDEFFACCYGQLPYRSLQFKFENYNREFYQPEGVVNYTVSEDFTRITEFKYLTGQKASNTTIMKEYPMTYTGEKGQIPYYAILSNENTALYERYKARLKDIPNFYLLGRLAEYKYYNMDAIIEKALQLGGTL